MPEPNARLFRAQHYNAIAKDIRELYASTSSELLPKEILTAARRTLEAVALKLAVRFAVDNSHFDPLHFLDACSPDTDLYPLSELWKKVK